MWPHEHPCNMLPCPSHQPDLESTPWGDGRRPRRLLVWQKPSQEYLHYNLLIYTPLNEEVLHNGKTRRFGGKYKPKRPGDSSFFVGVTTLSLSMGKPKGEAKL